MKLWIKLFFTGIIILAVFFVGVYLFLVFQGKTLITKQLGALTQKEVSIGYFGLTPPFNIEIRNLEVKDLAKVESVSISPSVFAFLTGRIVLDEIKIIRPEIIYQRISPQIMSLPGTVPAPAATAPITPTAPAAAKKMPLRFAFKHIIIQDGRINFIDHTVGHEGIKITLKDINFNLDNLYVFPRSMITNFALKGKIPWQEGQAEGKIEAEGWLNLSKKDMQASVKIEDIDGVYLYPYYSHWVDLEKARIEKAKLNLFSNIHGLNNNLTAECHLELTDIVRKPRSPEEAEEKAEKIASVILDVFRALNQGKIILDFTIRTKMDRPEFGFGNIKMAFEEKLAQGRKGGGFNPQDILLLPTNILQGAVKGMTDLSKSVITGTFSVGKELKKAVEDTFKKEPKVEQEKKEEKKEEKEESK